MDAKDIEREENDELPVIDGELLEVSAEDEIELGVDEERAVQEKVQTKAAIRQLKGKDKIEQNSKAYLQYLFLPFIFLTVALLGGLRIGIDGGEFLFFRPALICLVFAVLLMLLFFRAKLIVFDSWFSYEFSALRNMANGAVFVSLFAASTQIFNSLIPEQGLPFWVVGFCFFWTLWNNLFAQFETQRLLKSLGGLFGFAFFAKYLVLSNLVSAEQGSWLSRIWQDPAKEAVTYFLDLPRFSSATGYIQFFALVFFLIGLFFIKPKMEDRSAQN